MPEARIPQNLFAVTLGASDVARQRNFYESWGWKAVPVSNEEYAAFDLSGTMVAFFAKELLAAEAAPGESVPDAQWKGVTLAINLPARDDVDQTWQAAVQAGAHAVGQPEDRAWGGRSGYVADPEGNRWEIAWVPQEAMG